MVVHLLLGILQLLRTAVTRCVLHIEIDLRQDERSLLGLRRKIGRQEASLERVGDAVSLAVETGVVQCLRGPPREVLRELEVVVGERLWLLCPDKNEGAERPPPCEERDNDERTHPERANERALLLRDQHAIEEVVLDERGECRFTGRHRFHHQALGLVRLRKVCLRHLANELVLRTVPMRRGHPIDPLFRAEPRELGTWIVRRGG